MLKHQAMATLTGALLAIACTRSHGELDANESSPSAVSSGAELAPAPARATAVPSATGLPSERQPSERGSPRAATKALAARLYRSMHPVARDGEQLCRRLAKWKADPELAKDAWGTKFNVRCGAQSPVIVITSAGEDRKLGTDDDLEFVKEPLIVID